LYSALRENTANENDDDENETINCVDVYILVEAGACDKLLSSFLAVSAKFKPWTSFSSITKVHCSPFPA